jgi:hypothetical protein
MNKAAFLDIINHVTSISEQEVIELEKLALNFPYCQSAHLLLAKSAYDKGSMLSNQRLRRAAACAVNRQLLKKLIYTSGTHLVLEPIAPSDMAAVLPGPEPLEYEPLEIETYDPIPDAGEVTTTESGAENVLPAALPGLELTGMEPLEMEPLEMESGDLALLEMESGDTASQPEAMSLPQPPAEEGFLTEEEDFLTEEIPQPQLPAAALAPSLPELYEVPDLIEAADISARRQQPLVLPTPDQSKPEEAEPATLVELPVLAQSDQSEDVDDLFAIDFLTPMVPYLDPVTAFLTTLEDQEPAVAEEADLSAPEKEKVAETSVVEVLAASLPALDPAPSLGAEEPDETLIQFDNYLFTPEKEQEPEAGATSGQAYQEEIIYKVFDANELGYWMDSSRLGETLLKKNELATSQPYFFRPELLLEYSHHHEIASYEAPEPGILARQLDIIDQFLKLNPKIKSMAQLKIKSESQEDLSFKSSKIKKTVASETLANILVQQGKIKKAIKIYEHLILKLPEKKDYFASQIGKLQNIA